MKKDPLQDRYYNACSSNSSPINDLGNPSYPTFFHQRSFTQRHIWLKQIVKSDSPRKPLK
ncbi:hypothetical protein Bca4012_042937 [Brassica carinata]